MTLTGESLPVSKARGVAVIGASINTTGTMRARATKVGSDTALAQIVALVQEAQNSKAPGHRLADRAAFWLVLVALIGGTGTGTLTHGEPEVTDVVVEGVDVGSLMARRDDFAAPGRPVVGRCRSLCRIFTENLSLGRGHGSMVVIVAPARESPPG